MNFSGRTAIGHAVLVRRAEGAGGAFLWADGAALQAAAIPSAFRYYFDTAVRWLAAQQGGTDHGTALL